MLKNNYIPRQLNRYLVAVAVICAAAALRIWPLYPLGSTLSWLTFYPAVMVASIYGGLLSGLLGTVLACFIVVFAWPILVAQPFIKNPADWLGLLVFVLTGTMISCVAEAMLRANLRAKKAKEEAEASSKAKSAFLASMSHELRTPLNAILGFSELMQEDVTLNRDQRETLAIINRSGEHLLDLINDVLDMAKIESGNNAEEKIPFDLHEMVFGVIDLLNGRAIGKKLKLSLDPDSEYPRFIVGDVLKLRQVMINLVGNAIKFTESGGVTVRLSSRKSAASGNESLLFEVIDTGPGIEPEDQVRIFEPFIQVGTLRTRKGTGLGLAITKKFVKVMGGEIDVVSTLGVGSIFRVEIPLVRTEEDFVSREGPKPGRIIGLLEPHPEYRILIVEDQIENWRLLKQLLENVGFSVRVAENGALGVTAFQEWRPHFIWMDIRMEVMDGLEATRKIRQLEGGDKVKISALTASAFKEEREPILAAGMDDLLLKPFRSIEVFNCLQRHLNLGFVYELGEGFLTEPSYALEPETFSALSDELRVRLESALISLDDSKIIRVIEEVNTMSPTLAEILRHHVDHFGYSKILQALSESADDVSTEKK